MKLPARKLSANSALKIPKRTRAAKSHNREARGIDREAFRAALTERHLEGGPQLRRDVLALFKSTLKFAMDEATILFDAGRLGGLEMARHIAAIYDEILISLYEYTVTHIIRVSNPTRGERMAFCVVGGNGRSEMAPFSDLDLLFLIADKKGSAFTETVTEHMLYMLWDMNLKVGYSTRSIDQCLTLAKEDQTILTALLDMRYLCGDEDLANELYTRFRGEVTKGKGRAYIKKARAACVICMCFIGSRAILIRTVRS